MNLHIIQEVLIPESGPVWTLPKDSTKMGLALRFYYQVLTEPHVDSMI